MAVTGRKPGPARRSAPSMTTAATIVQFDGVDDFLALAGPLPALEPFSVGVVYRVRDRGDFTGILSRRAAGRHRPLCLLDLSQRLRRLVRHAAVRSLGRGQPAAARAGGRRRGAERGLGLRDGHRSSCAMPRDRARILMAAASARPPASCSAAATAARPSAMRRSTCSRRSAPARALSVTDQQRLVDWANARWSL